MSTIDLIIWGSQSNAFQTTDRTGPAGVKIQTGVPAWTCVILNPGSGRLKVAPRFSEGFQANKQTFPLSASREWCAAPEFAAYRLANTHGHSVRLMKFAIGASTYDGDWPNYASALMGHYLGQALTAADYPGTPTLRVLVTIHGESDVNTTSATYGDKIPGVISAARTRTGATTHVVVVQLNSAYNGGEADVATKRTAIRDAQAAWVAGDDDASLLDSSVATLGADSVHYAEAGATTLGNALADHIDGLL